MEILLIVPEKLTELASAAQKARRVYEACAVRSVSGLSAEKQAEARVEFDLAYEDWQRAERAYRTALDGSTRSVR